MSLFRFYVSSLLANVNEGIMFTYIFFKCEADVIIAVIVFSSVPRETLYFVPFCHIPRAPRLVHQRARAHAVGRAYIYL